MAAAPVQPTPEDVSMAAVLFEWLRQWGGPLFGSGAVVGAFNAGRKVSRLVNVQDHHADKLGEHEKDIETLKVASAAAAVRLAEYPTRADLARESEATRQEMRAGLANLTQLVGSMRRD